jgi:hypothetical protein
LSDDERRLLSTIAEGADGCTNARHAITLKALSAKSVTGTSASAENGTERRHSRCKAWIPTK